MCLLVLFCANLKVTDCEVGEFEMVFKQCQVDILLSLTFDLALF